jgi:hypothetical protein
VRVSGSGFGVLVSATDRGGRAAAAALDWASPVVTVSVKRASALAVAVRLLPMKGVIDACA